MTYPEVLAALRAWSGNPSAYISDFSNQEIESATRAVLALRAIIADRVAMQRSEFLEQFRETGEPSIHGVLYARANTEAERIIRGGN